jgi:polyferredoxin
MKNYNQFTQTFPITVLFTTVVTLVLVFIGQKVWGISFLLGSVTSLWAMSLLYKSSAKILKQDEKDARKTAFINYLIRFAMYALILVVAYLLDNFEFYAVAAGLFSFKLMLYAQVFVQRKGDTK